MDYHLPVRAKKPVPTAVPVKSHLPERKRLHGISGASDAGFQRASVAEQIASGFRDPTFSHNFCEVSVYTQTMPRLQAKLNVSTPGDVYEREADSVAEKVMGLGSQAGRLVQPRAEADNVVQQKGATDIPAAPPAIDQVLRSPGHSLDRDTRGLMEPRFGYDFSRVRVHSDDAAGKSARDVRANAYTVGHQIVFDPDRYAPGTYDGRRLIAHELTHVVQQSGLKGNPNLPIHFGEPVLARQISTPNIVNLSDPALQAEHERVRQWLLRHNLVELDYMPTKEYFDAIEAEVLRRNLPAGTATGAGKASGPAVPPGIQVPPGAFRLTIPPPGTLFSGPRAPASDRPAPVTASHAGGALGERELAFALGEQGVHLVVTSAGPGGHSLTGHGFDAIGWDPKSRELWLIDNKSAGALGKLEGSKATALGVNLESSLAEAVTLVRKIPDFPDKAEILSKLEKALAGVKAKTGIPAGLNVKLKLTNAGGYGGGAGVGARNLPPRTTAEDLVSPAVRKARGDDVAAARVNEASPSRPRSHEDTEAARVKVAGAQSREPIVRSLGQKIGLKIKGSGGVILKNAAIIAWNYMMSRIERKIEKAIVRPILEKQMVGLQPQIEARLNDQVALLADLQTSHPGKPIYGNVSVKITADRSGDEDGDETLFDINTVITDVSVAADAVTAESYERFWTGIKYISYKPHDVTRGTFPMELEPLSPEALRAVLGQRIAELEQAESNRSATPEAIKASARERNRLAGQLGKLETP